MKRSNYLAIVIAAIIITGFVGGSNTLVPEAFAQNAITGNEGSANKTLRLGYFPNINHAQAVIGVGSGDFQKVLGPDVKLETVVFNAGPSAIEALLAKRIDATYVGSNPAINRYVVSDGEALRKYIRDNGFKTTENGGNVTVLPIANPDILTLFLKKEIDGAWVPEPWGARLIKEGNGRIFLDERDLWPNGKFVTANIAVSTDYLKNNPDVIKKLLTAHVNETNWINSHKEEAIKVFNTEIKKLTGKTIPEDELRDGLARLEITYDPLKLSLFQSANNAYDVGLLAKGQPRPVLTGIFDTTQLNEVLSEKGLPPINGGAASTTTNASAIEESFGAVE